MPDASSKHIAGGPLNRKYGRGKSQATSRRFPMGIKITVPQKTGRTIRGLQHWGVPKNPLLAPICPLTPVRASWGRAVI